MDNSPIILIGAARSGTKFLRDVLAQDHAIKSVPYDVNYIWRTGQLGKPDDVLQPEFATDVTVQKIRCALEKLSGLTDQSHGQIIEKSVSNTLRVPFVNHVYPNARYIHLVRNGYAVIESSRRMWKQPPHTASLVRKLRELPFDHYGYIAWFARNYLKGLVYGRSGGEVWGPRYPNISVDISTEDLLVVAARQWNWCVRKANADLAKIPSNRVMTIRFEDLAKDEKEVRKLAEFSCVSDIETTVGAIRRGFDISNVEKWRSRLTPEEIETIGREAAEALAIFGYRENRA